MATSGLPFDYQAELEKAQRKRALAQLIQKQAMNFQGAQSHGTVASRTSPFAAIANIAQAGLGGYMDAKGAADESGIKKRYQTDSTQAVRDWQGLPDDNARITQGQTSQFDIIKQLSTDLQKQKNTRFDSVLTAVGKDSPNVMIGMAKTNQLPTDPIPETLETVNGQRVPRTQAGDFRTQYKPPTVMAPGNGLSPILTQTSDTGQVEAIDKAPKVSVGGPNISVSQGKGETSFAEALGKDTAKQFADSREAAKTGYQMQAAAKQLKDLDAKGVFSGPTATPATMLAGVAQTLGIPVDAAKLANSQAYQAEVAGILTKNLTGSLARSTTDKDLETIKSSLPQLISSPQGRAWLYQKMEASAATDISRHASFQKQLVENYPEHKGLLTLNPVDMSYGPGVLPPGAPVVSGAQSGNKPPLTIDQLSPAQKAQLRQLLGQ